MVRSEAGTPDLAPVAWTSVHPEQSALIIILTLAYQPWRLSSIHPGNAGEKVKGVPRHATLALAENDHSKQNNKKRKRDPMEKQDPRHCSERVG